MKQIPYEDVKDICEAAVDVVEILSEGFSPWKTISPANIYNMFKPHFTNSGSCLITSSGCAAWVCTCLKLGKSIDDVVIATEITYLGMVYSKAIEKYKVDIWLQIFVQVFDKPEPFIRGLEYLNPREVKETKQIIDYMLGFNKPEFVAIFIRWLEENGQTKETSYRL